MASSDCKVITAAEMAEVGKSQAEQPNCLSMKPEQKTKLGELFQHIISNAPVDFSNKEVQDIQTAVHTMLERIKERVNGRGIFNIARIVKSGSMAEKTSIWKFDEDEHIYLEFDFLAVLEAIIKDCVDQALHRCQGCIRIANPPLNKERLRQNYNRYIEFETTQLQMKSVIGNIFLTELHNCLTSSCECLSRRGKKTLKGYFTSFRHSSKFKYGCDKCIVDMPTGVLSVNTEIPINHSSKCTNHCSLILMWTSKRTNISAPDPWLLQRHQTISPLPVYIDFLPALEFFKTAHSNMGDNHDFFIVPKRCNMCDIYGDDDEFNKSDVFWWRKSWCLAEVSAFVTEMSEKHKRCYQIMKYFNPIFHAYILKTIALYHHTSCSNATNNYVECVIEMCHALLNIYETKTLLSHYSQIVIFNSDYDQESERVRCKKLLNFLCSVSEKDSWETFVGKARDEKVLNASQYLFV